ncbi:hypothetical protein O3P69_013413 [Scylla paramamosain]|uniref:Uncharacterized protein n=1 Tax=Scylla paramamosain TaxID=85552 RepID=A0AAW0U0C0_SCYPA
MYICRGTTGCDSQVAPISLPFHSSLVACTPAILEKLRTPTTQHYHCPLLYRSVRTLQHIIPSFFVTVKGGRRCGAVRCGHVQYVCVRVSTC